MIGYVKCFQSNKTVYFKINGNKLLNKYTQTWKKVKNLLNIKFDGESAYNDNDKCIKTKMKIYDGDVNTNFQGKKVRKENASNECLSLIILDSVVKVKKYNPHTLLEECKYETQKTKMENLINADLEASSSDDEIGSDSDNDETESDNEKDIGESNE